MSLSFYRIKKILSPIIYVDLKIICRSYGLYFFIILNFLILIFVGISNNRVVPYLPYIGVVMVMISFNEIITNMVSRTNNEFLLFSLYPVNIDFILYGRNISTFLLLTMLVIFINGLLLIFFGLCLKVIIRALIYYFFLLMVVMMYGNYVSVKSIGRCRKSITLFNFLIYQIVICVSSSLYFLLYIFSQNSLPFVFLLSGFVYYLLLIRSGKLIVGYKYKILEY